MDVYRILITCYQHFVPTSRSAALSLSNVLQLFEQFCSYNILPTSELIYQLFIRFKKTRFWLILFLNKIMKASFSLHACVGLTYRQQIISWGFGISVDFGWNFMDFLSFIRGTDSFRVFMPRSPSEFARVNNCGSPFTPDIYIAPLQETYSEVNADYNHPPLPIVDSLPYRHGDVPPLPGVAIPRVCVRTYDAVLLKYIRAMLFCLSI